MSYKETDKKKVRAQLQLCKALMASLEELISENIDEKTTYYYYGGMPNHYQVKQDVIRFRRELHKLSNMVQPGWEN